jgi:hypothetical protein
LEILRSRDEDFFILRGNPQHHEERHHGGDEVGVGDFPRAAVVRCGFFAGHGFKSLSGKFKSKAEARASRAVLKLKLET